MKKCNVPKEIEFKTKSLAVEMLLGLQNERRIRFKYIVADSIYGNSLKFIDAIESIFGTGARCLKVPRG